MKGVHGVGVRRADPEMHCSDLHGNPGENLAAEATQNTSPQHQGVALNLY